MAPRQKPREGKADPPLARKSPKSGGSRVRDLEKRLAEAIEQQTTTREILRVIADSPADLQAVLNTVAERAARLCGANDSMIFQVDGDTLRPVVRWGSVPTVLDADTRIPISRAAVTGRALVDRDVVHIHDITTRFDEFLVSQRYMGRTGVRTVLAVPLLRHDTAIGAIQIRRLEIQPFTDKQIDLLKTFADQAVIAIENARLFHETKEALEQQTATSEILRVISQSPTDLQPVMDAVAENAARVCGADDAVIFRLDGDVSRSVAHHGTIPVNLGERRPITRDSMSGRAMMDGQTIHIADIEAVPADDLVEGKVLAKRSGGLRTHLAAPLMREGKAIGAILIRRFEVRAFTDKQISLLETFADQAVIAIENVRLFNETKQALERQTATSEILRVISSSPMDVQPVLDAVAESATRLCGATDALVYRVETGMILRVAHFGPVPSVSDARPVTRETVTGRSILERRAIHVHDLLNEMDQGEYAETQSLQGGIRTVLSVPLTREDLVLGAITIRRTQVDPFTEPQIELLKTFADQAVIAIENVRLFTELQASNRELTTALDTQTATSDILRVISRSQTDVQPVFDAIVESAARLLGVHLISMTRVVGDQVDLAALTGPDVRGVAVVRAAFPMTLESPGVHTRAIRDRVAINCADVHADPLTTEHGHAIARALGYESLTVVPMIRDDVAVGSISAARQERGGFTHDEIALLQTFADQAVIAIENVRLLTELQARTHELTRSVDQLTALGDVGRAVSSSLDLDTVLTTIVGRAVQLSGTDGGTIFEYDESAEEFTARATLNADAAQSAMLRTTRLRRGEGAVGQMAVTQEPFQIPDIAAEGAYESRIRGAMLESGTRSVLAIPLLHEQRLVGGLVVTRRVSGEFSAEVVDLLRTFATQSALAIQNARLFREIEIKSRELEVASQHKSEFLASMSHELRTPLNAIIGFSDVLLQGMFGEMSEKQTEYLQDILASGQHLLSLINDILDLSKIEAGRMDLDVAAFDLPSAIDDALLLMRERASRRSLTLERQVDERLGEIRADQRKVKQVLLNLLSNAVKFTPEGGRIEVRAALVDGAVEISVTDTGIGIAPEDHEAVFEEFRQVGKAEKKAEGTGLGLALCRKFVELHGGKIWVKSELGQGSTFAFTIPVRHG